MAYETLMADVNLSIPEHIHMAIKYNLLLLDGCHAVAHVEE